MNTKYNRPSVEPLESRIAPARVIEVGFPGASNDTDYSEAAPSGEVLHFVNLETASGADLIAAAVGKGIGGLADTFYIRMSAGDVMELFRGGGGASTEPLLIVNSGNIVAFFTDKNLDDEVQESEITGISAGKNASFELRAALPGDVVVNLDERGTKDQADDTLWMGAGPVPAGLGIKSVKIGSSVGGSVDEGVLFQIAAETIAGGVGVQEVQDFSISTAQGRIGQTFRISYGAYTTASLVVVTSAAEIEAAINGLKAVKDAGEVTVTSAANGQFTATFKLTGAQADLFEVHADAVIDFTASEVTPGGVAEQEVQSVDIGSLAGESGQLTFSFGVESSAPLRFDATAEEIETALNLLNTVSGVGGVTVIRPSGGLFLITFNEPGDQAELFAAHAEQFVVGSVGGNILASGSISNINVAGGVQRILAGSAANGQTFDFFPKYTTSSGVVVDTPGGDGLFSFAPLTGMAGSGISNIIVDRLGAGGDNVGMIHAGDGGDGANGGSLNLIEIRRDSDGFSLLAGDGGNSGGLKKNGGHGGGVTKVYAHGNPDASGNDLITVAAGAGGDSATALGGRGGSIADLNIGYELAGKNLILSEGVLRDNVIVLSGDGGDGKVGASGGSLTKINITISAPDLAGDEVQVFAGDGGDGQSVRGGRGGTGGTISRSFFQNVDITPSHEMTIMAGAGGLAGTNAIGAAGGSVLDLTLTGRWFDIGAGDGSDGKKGGLGGSIKAITFVTVNSVITDTAMINAGRGGDGLGGNAGNGGMVAGVDLPDSDLFNFIINDEMLGKGDGGTGSGGRGGNGGGISNISVTDSEFGVARNAANLYSVRGGAGGSGDKGGGAGGSLAELLFSGSGIEVEVTAGDGGDADIKGPGGKAGSIARSSFFTEGTVLRTVSGVPVQVAADGFVRAGAGGDGAGAGGAGGLGGEVSTVDLNTEGTAGVFGGDGGNGSGAGSGRGGSLNRVGLFATNGDGTMIAGDAGTIGTKPAAGGSIRGTTDEQVSGAFAALNVTVRAGEGANGGAGGSIDQFGYGSTGATLVPTPLGNIIIMAGDGSESGDGRNVGAGGSIKNINGSVSFTSGTTTTIQAGEGGSTPKKGGAGGDIKNLSLQRGGNPGVEVSIVAGDAGDSPAGARGAKGGSVDGVTVIEMDRAAILRHITAGNGGDALKMGGPGGSVTNVNVVNHDIGLRSGAAYGYDSMGGIFAGAGGSGDTKGLAGNVISVSADAIGSIVAGRGAAPELVNKVESIYLNDSNLLIEKDGAFTEDGIPGAKEEQQFTPASGFQFQITFGEYTTGNLQPNSTTAQVEAALNLLLSISSIGGVTVTKPVGPSAYKITFNEVGDRQPLQISNQLNVIEVARGDDEPPIMEKQTVQLDPTLFSSITAKFGGSSAFFSDASLITAGSLETGLNAMASVMDLLGVTVTDLPNSSFEITFNEPGNQAPFNFGAHNSPSGFATEITDGTNNTQIIYINGAERTIPLNKDAAPVDVANALNALPSIIAAGGVSATALLPNGYQVVFLAPGDNPQITAEEFVGVNAAVELTGEANTQLKVFELLQGSTTTQVKEVQTVRIDPLLLGRVNVNFGPSVASFSSADQITAATLNSRLNLLPTIITAGGVTVLAQENHTFRITFDQFGDQIPIHVEGDDFLLGSAAEIVAGDSVTQEIQRFTPIAGGSFQVNFGADTTNLIVSTSTAIQVQSLLNALPSISSIGGVTVTQDIGTEGYAVTFNQNGDRAPLSVTNRTGIAGSLLTQASAATLTLGDPVTNEVQRISLPSTGFIALSFTGLETSQTSFMPLNSSASFVEASLNALPSVIAAGGVTLTVSPGGDFYEIAFNEPGSRNQFNGTAIEVEQTVTELFHGMNRLAAFEVQSIEYDLNGEFTVTFPVALTAVENLQGFSGGREGQLLDLSSVQAIGAATFTLSFGDDTTNPPLSANADAAAIQADLNLLPSIISAGGVTVDLVSPGLFSITFGNLGDQPGVITGAVTGSEVTGPINGNDTPDNVRMALEDALNQLPSVIASGGVSVALPSEKNSLNVIFNTIGNKPSLTAVNNSYEVQTIALFSTGEYELSYGAATTLRLPAGSTTGEIESALNSLAGFPAGGVVVTNGFGEDFTITFNDAGDFNLITARQFFPTDAITVQEGTSGPAGLQEKQEIRQPIGHLFDQENFATANLVGGFNDATEFDAFKFKWQDANNNELYDLGEIPIDGLIVARTYNSALINLIPEARYTGGEFTFVSITEGGPAIAEVQELTIKADKFTLVFGDDETGSLSGKAKPSAVAAALNALPAIIAAGGVTVTSSAVDTYRITFNVAGARDPVLAPFFYDFNNILQ